ncbi:hypothetical protein ACHAXA_003096 [Cyclostephanos tholiformis]|uniref:Uncharacterized protein n=1 Tax=Cyclostephanos tholiformis TaxID=382380 RepID=A0ABD3ST21_9STRA
MRQVAAEAMAPAPAITSAEAVDNYNSYREENDDVARGDSSSSSSSGSAVPNLSFGYFSPHSPKELIAATSTNYFFDHNAATTVASSPTIPAAPPSTPLIYKSNDIINPLNHLTLPPSSSLMRLPYSESSNTMESSTSSPFAPSPQPFNIRPIWPGVGSVLPLSASAGIGGVASPPLSPSHQNHHHYDALLRQALHATAERERLRIESLTRHESENYSTIEQYQRALAYERRHHSTALALEVTKLSFHNRYTSCDVHSAAEISEEARINNMIKNITTLKKDMNEDRCRVVMELEREEERIINRLMMRLEVVTREKRLLECQIKGLGSVRKQGIWGGGNVSGADVGGRDRDGGFYDVHGGEALMGNRNNDHGLHAQFERMVMMVNDSNGSNRKHNRQVQHETAVPNAPLLRRVVAGEVASDDSNTGTMKERGHFLVKAAADAVAEERLIGSELVISRNNRVSEECEDGDDEEEEDDNGADYILEGRCHNDSDMEVELENLLKIKEGHPHK